MDAFRYQALDAEGRTRSGVLQADSPRQARAQLRAQGLLPSSLQPLQQRSAITWVPARGLSAAELSLLTRQLGCLLDSGLTIEQSLNALIEAAENTRARELLAAVKSEISAGQSLAGALTLHERSFPNFYCALVRGGEQSGALATVLQHLADYLDARQALRQKTMLALLYPLLVTAVAFLIVTGLMLYVVPQVVEVFEQSRQELPWLTRALIALSDGLSGRWPFLLIALVALGAIGRWLLNIPEWRRRCDDQLLRLPWLGGLLRGVDSARFASTLAILVRGGVPLLTALESGAQVLANSVMRDAVEQSSARLREGASLSHALAETGRFPPLLVHLVASGELSGTLEVMLERAARLETQALERRLAIFLALLEPAMILVMGGVVLLIVLAILLPILEVNQLVH